MQADVGTPKVHCIARTLRSISRNIEVDCRAELWRLDDFGGELLEGVDWVVGQYSMMWSHPKHDKLMTPQTLSTISPPKSNSSNTATIVISRYAFYIVYRLSTQTRLHRYFLLWAQGQNVTLRVSK